MDISKIHEILSKFTNYFHIHEIIFQICELFHHDELFSNQQIFF